MGCVKARKENVGVCQDEVYRTCMGVDSFIAKELMESIIIGTSYEMLEAHHGILPISKRSFYRRKATAQRLIRQRGMRYIEEKNGQLRMDLNALAGENRSCGCTTICYNGYIRR